MIARWDVVPRQTFTDTFNVGIVAFHLNGIDRVEIAADGGAWTTVTEMTWNERTRVVEYWATLKASDFSDGMSELRAVIYPKSAGEPRVLSGLELYANGGGTMASEVVYVSPGRGDDTNGDGTEDNPYATYLQGVEHLMDSPGGLGGGTVYLDTGLYQYPNPSGDGCGGRWLTIAPWPGVPRDQVVWSGAGSGVLQRWLHIRGVTINHSVEDAPAFKLRSSPYGNQFWVDSCETYGTGYAGDSLSSGSFVKGGGVWQTDVTTHDHKGTVGGSIVRNIDAWYLSGDFVNSRGLNINCRLRHMRPAPGVHPDIVQHYSGTTDNYIMYGLKAIDAKAQGINIGQLDTVRDMALVNVQIEHYPTALRNFIPSAAGLANHILMWNNMYTGASTVPGESRTDQTNLDIRGCVFSNINLSSTGDFSGWTMDNNHFYNQDDMTGTNASYGDPLFTADPVWDSTGRQITPGDYEIQAGSPLLGRMDNILVPVDVDGNLRKSPTAVGPYAGPEETSIDNGQLTFDKKRPVLHLPNPITAMQLVQFQARTAGFTLHDLQGRRIADWSSAETGIYTLVSGKMSFKIMVSGKK